MQLKSITEDQFLHEAFSYPLFPLLFSSCTLLSGRAHSLIQVCELGARLWEAVRISGARERHSRSLLLRSLAVQLALAEERQSQFSNESTLGIGLGPGAFRRRNGRQRRSLEKQFICVTSGLPWRLSGQESTCQCQRHRFDPWSGRIPHPREDPPCPGAPKPVHHNHWACAVEPGTAPSEAWVRYNLCIAATAAAAARSPADILQSVQKTALHFNM